MCPLAICLIKTLGKRHRSNFHKVEGVRPGPEQAGQRMEREEVRSSSTDWRSRFPLERPDLHLLLRRSYKSIFLNSKIFSLYGRPMMRGRELRYKWRDYYCGRKDTGNKTANCKP